MKRFTFIIILALTLAATASAAGPSISLSTTYIDLGTCSAADPSTCVTVPFTETNIGTITLTGGSLSATGSGGFALDASLACSQPGPFAPGVVCPYTVTAIANNVPGVYTGRVCFVYDQVKPSSYCVRVKVRLA